MIKRVGAGAFGKIYLGENIETHTPVAIKIEIAAKRMQVLEYEYRVMNLLKDCPQIPAVHQLISSGETRFMVLDFLGKSLEQLFKLCHYKFSLKTCLMITIQMISAVEYVHKMGFVFRDIKPENFLIGELNRKNQIFLIDFGLSKQFLDPKTQKHVVFDGDKGVVGTVRYSSILSLKGCEQS